VKDKLVPVELHFSQDKSDLSTDTIAQNESLAEKHQIQGRYPMIILTDEEGKPFAQTGYQPGRATAYVTYLDALLASHSKRDAAFAKADKAKGLEKAEALVLGVTSMELEDGLISAFYGDEGAALRAADPSDETGDIKDMESKQSFAGFEQDLNRLAGTRDFEGALKLIDGTLTSGKFSGA
jgi:hypothetical protein